MNCWRGTNEKRHPWFLAEPREQTEEEKQAMREAKVTVFAPDRLPEPLQQEEDES